MQNITWMTLVRYSLFFATGKLNEIQQTTTKKLSWRSKRTKKKSCGREISMNCCLLMD